MVRIEIAESEARLQIRKYSMDTRTNDGDTEAGLGLRTAGTIWRQRAIVIACFHLIGGAASLGATRVGTRGTAMVLAATGNRVGFSMNPKHRRDSLHGAATTIWAYDETEDDLQDNSNADHERTAIC